MISNNVNPEKLQKIPQQSPSTKIHLRYTLSVPASSGVHPHGIFAHTIVSDSYIAHCFVETSQEKRRFFYLRLDQLDLGSNSSQPPSFPSVADFGCEQQMQAFDRMRFDFETKETSWAVQACTHAANFLHQVRERGEVEIIFDSVHGTSLPKSSAAVQHILRPLCDRQTGIKDCKKVYIGGSLLAESTNMSWNVARNMANGSVDFLFGKREASWAII